MISSFVVQYLAMVKRFRYVIVIMWIAIVGASINFMADFPGDCSTSLLPPPGSPALAAKAFYESIWTMGNTNTAMYYYVETTDPNRPLTSQNNSEWAEGFYYPLDRSIAWWFTTGEMTNSSTPAKHFDFDNGPKPKALKGRTWSSYWLSSRLEFPSWIAAANLNKARVGAKIDVAFPAKVGAQETKDFVKALPGKLAELRTAYGLDGQVTFAGFGEINFTDDIAEAAAKDIVSMFIIVLPLAMLVFCISLSSARFFLLLLTVLISNAAVSFAILDIIIKSGQEINSLTTGVAAAFGLSLTTDYTYFIMCKFRKQMRNLGEVRKEHSVPLLELVLSSAGRTIFTSCITICCASFGLLFLPVNIYSSIGWCALVCPLVALAVSLNLVPAMLCIQPEFWMHGAMPNCTGSDNEKEQQQDTHVSGYFAPLFVDVETCPMNEEEQLKEHLKHEQDFAPGIGSGQEFTASNGVSIRSEDPQEGSPLRTSRAEPSSSTNFANPNTPVLPLQDDEQKKTATTNGENHSSHGDGSSAVTHLSSGLLPQQSRMPSTTSPGLSFRLKDSRRISGASAFTTRSHAVSMASAMSRVTKTNVSLHNQVSRHYQLVDYITRFPNNLCVIFLVLAITIIPIVYAFNENNVSNDIREFLPRGTATYDAWERFTDTYPKGEAFPFFWIVDLGDVPFPFPPTLSPIPGGGAKIVKGKWEFTYKPCEDCRAVAYIQGLILDFLAEFKSYGFEARHIKNALFDGPSNATHPELLLPTMDLWERCPIIGLFPLPDPEHAYCQYVSLLRQLFAPPKVNGKVTFNGTWIWVTTPFNPASRQGLEFYDAWKDWRPKAERKWAIKSSQVQGYGAETSESIEYARKTLPRVVAITFGVLFVIVTLMFGTPMVTLRVALTAALGVAVAFGFVNMVYVGQVFNFLGWNGLSGLGQVAWPIPFTIFLVSTGIATNYALISTIRALEFYWLGVPTDLAIKYGAADSGREITVAAGMMMLIFSGLMFSSVSALSQMGLYLVMTALVSGLLYRLFLTPPLMAVLGDWNWWRPWPLSKLTPFVLPAGAKKAKGAFQGEDFLVGPSEYQANSARDSELYQESTKGNGGPAYRESTAVLDNRAESSGGYGTTAPKATVDTKAL